MITISRGIMYQDGKEIKPEIGNLKHIEALKNANDGNAANDPKSRKIQIIICKCGSVFSGCTVPECYTDEDYTKELKGYVEAGCTVDLVPAGNFKFEECRCPKN